MKATCTNCGTEFQMGKNGITTANGDQCDECAGVVRGRDGTAIESAEEHCYCFEKMGDNPECPLHGSAK